MKKLVLITTFLISVNASAFIIEDCSDLNKLNQKWKSHYHSQLNVQEALTDLKCGDENYKIAQALNLLEEYHSPDLKFNFYSDMLVNSINALAKKFSLGGEDARCAITNINIGLVTLRDCFFSEDVYYRAGSLVHEARHAEMKEVGKHIICTHGEKRGTRNCDSEFSNNWDSAGPHSYEVMFYTELYHSQNPKIDRQSLKELINGNLDSSFNKIDSALKQQYYIN